MRITSRSAIATIGYAAFALLGWSSLLVPSMIRLIERDYVQSDASIGVFYYAYASAYAAGSFAGGFATEHLRIRDEIRRPKARLPQNRERPADDNQLRAFEEADKPVRDAQLPPRRTW
jgi:hypothetical protein